MQPYNWGQFKLRIPIKASAERLYKLWMTREGLEAWFLRKAEFKNPDGEIVLSKDFVEVGDTYTWLWYGYDDETAERGEILKTNGKDSLQFSFGAAGNVTVSFKEEDGEMMIELVQEDIPTDEKGKEFYHLGCSKGWVFYLANIKAFVEGGLDLRNKNINLKDVVSS